MSVACGCTKALGSTNGISPSREYTATAAPATAARSAGAPAAEESAHPRSKLLRLQLRAEDACLRLDACQELLRVRAQQTPRSLERIRRLLRHAARQPPRLFEERR